MRRRARLAGRSMRVCFAVLCTALAPAACGGEKTFDPPDRAARLVEAEALFAEVRFDTVTWTSSDERSIVGNAVFAARCRKCHGTVGRGTDASGAEYALSRGLSVPSLVEPGWRLAAEPDSLRHIIFVGHAGGMPTWGVAGITQREIDAVAHYIVDELRPEILGEGEG